MDKKRSLDILIANACCSMSFCNKQCPWDGTEDCKNAVMSRELIIEAINTLREENTL